MITEKCPYCHLDVVRPSVQAHAEYHRVERDRALNLAELVMMVSRQVRRLSAAAEQGEP